jgi:Xaa-Pro aminopeptidase
MDGLLPLVVAALGAAIGAYFAVVKSARERLWTDRYEALRDVVLGLGTVEAHFSAANLELMGVSVMAESEQLGLRESWPQAMANVRQNIAKLRLLFPEAELAQLREAARNLDQAFTDLFHGEHHEQVDLHGWVAHQAAALAEHAIRIAQQHCARPIRSHGMFRRR